MSKSHRPKEFSNQRSIIIKRNLQLRCCHWCYYQIFPVQQFRKLMHGFSKLHKGMWLLLHLGLNEYDAHPHGWSYIMRAILPQILFIFPIYSNWHQLLTSLGNLLTSHSMTKLQYGMVWYGIVEFNVPLDTVQVISETRQL